MASHVLGWRRSRAAGVLHPLPRARVRGVEAASSTDRSRHRANGWWSLEDFSLSRSLDDTHDVSLAWHTGPLSGLPEIRARLRPQDGRLSGNSL